MSDKPTNRFRFFLLSFFFSGLGTNWWDDDFLFVAFFFLATNDVWEFDIEM